MFILEAWALLMYTPPVFQYEVIPMQCSTLFFSLSQENVLLTSKILASGTCSLPSVTLRFFGMLIHWKSHHSFEFQTFQVCVSSSYCRWEETLDTRTLKFRNITEEIHIYLVSATPKPIIMPTDLYCNNGRITISSSNSRQWSFPLAGA